MERGRGRERKKERGRGRGRERYREGGEGEKTEKREREKERQRDKKDRQRDQAYITEISERFTAGESAMTHLTVRPSTSTRPYPSSGTCSPLTTTSISTLCRRTTECARGCKISMPCSWPAAARMKAATSISKDSFVLCCISPVFASRGELEKGKWRAATCRTAANF